jgi:hypothetical protein
MYNGLLLHMDHFITFPETDDIEEYLKENYEKMGFVVSDKEVKQHPGLISRFVNLSGEYFEFNTIEDVTEFFEGKNKDKELIEIYDEHRPYGIGFVTEDIEEMYEHWRMRGYQVKDISYVVPRDFETEEFDPKQDPTWTYIPFPSTYARGVKSYVIEYKKRSKEERFKFVMGDNGIYAVNGVTLVTNYPHNRGEDWSNFFYSKNYHTPYLNECKMDLPPHFIQWITPQKFKMLYKTEYYPTKSEIGELYVIHLFTKDLEYTKNYFKERGKEVKEVNLRFGLDILKSILIERNHYDGFFFAVSERNPEEWLKWREERINERYEI